MVQFDIRSLGEALINGLFVSTATFVAHDQNAAPTAAGFGIPWLHGRAAASPALCAASLPTSCNYLASTNMLLFLGTIPYVCNNDIALMSPALYKTVSTRCPINFLQTGNNYLACLKSSLAATPVSTTCAAAAPATATSTSSAKSSLAPAITTSAITTSAITTSAITTSTSSKASSSAASLTVNTISSSTSLAASASVSIKPVAVENVTSGSDNYVKQGPAPVTPISVTVNGTTISANTSSSANSTTSTLENVTILGTSVKSTLLVIARDTAAAYSAYSGLNGYAIPFQVLIVPQAGTDLPSLNDTLTTGNFGGIIILSEVSYDYGATGFQSALSAAQWNTLYAYQLAFSVRMVRMDVFPSPSTGTSALGGCCAAGQEQYISISDSSQFPTAGLNIGATMSTLGLYHYPATVTNSTLATPFATFGETSGYPGTSTAGVINNISGRQQMVFFISFATNWSPTSNFLQHAWIHWVTRGLYTGFRRTYFGTQVDDMFLPSLIYYPGNQTNIFRIRPADMNAIRDWIPVINKKMNPGSSYFMEMGHNGNGNILAAEASTTSGTCKPGSVQYEGNADTPLEFQKVLGTGVSQWPPTYSEYPYSVACTNLDELRVWWADTTNRDAFAHVSHTFTHESENNATFDDINREIGWNVAWMKQTGISSAKIFSGNGLIPPAITGLHNGDALTAWSKNGVTSAVGDNTRAVLMNKQNEMWPLISTAAANGFDGMEIIPRWATTIYYNCDTTDCTVQEWINTSAGKGGIADLLNLERLSTSRHLLGLHHDPYMFHQANLRYTDVSETVVNGVSQKLSLIQIWVENAVAEMTRIVNWPLVSLKHDDIGASFMSRMARDGCNPKMSYIMDLRSSTITGVQLTSDGNKCSALIPVTVPGSVKDAQGFTTEQRGADPLTIWVKMSGSAVTFTLSTPVPW